MAHCEVVAVPRRGRDAVELRAAPAHEPLASCAFEWPPRWHVHTTDWQPPGLLALSPLFGLTAGPGDALRVSVARFGLEVDALAFVRERLGPERRAALTRAAWTGLSVAAIDLEVPHPHLRMVCTGPAVHVLEAHGAARRYVERAAATLHGLSGFDPPGEGLVTQAIGPLRFLRGASWGPRTEPAPHGYFRLHVRRLTHEGHLAGYLRVRVVDRRIHPGLLPAELAAETDRTLLFPELTLGAPVDEPAPGGPTRRRDGTLRELTVETRHAVRQVGPLLVHLDACFPGADRAPVTRLNGRRLFDIAVHSLRAEL